MDISMSCTNYLEPCLPPELERLTFELALAENDTKPSTLLLVANVGNCWTGFSRTSVLTPQDRGVMNPWGGIYH